MLSFIDTCLRSYCYLRLVSIHPMLSFIWAFSMDTSNKSYVSIHPMLSFILLANMNYETRLTRFNTSHVIVHQCGKLQQRIVCFVSIHPMLSFIGKYYSAMVDVTEFQYIPCYRSSQFLYRR